MECLLYRFGWIGRDREKEKKKHRQYIFIAGIHQSKREGKRRKNNMTNEKIDVNKICMENR
jgi:hypothetical protein